MRFFKNWGGAQLGAHVTGVAVQCQVISRGHRRIIGRPCGYVAVHPVMWVPIYLRGLPHKYVAPHIHSWRSSNLRGGPRVVCGYPIRYVGGHDNSWPSISIRGSPYNMRGPPAFPRGLPPIPRGLPHRLWPLLWQPKAGILPTCLGGHALRMAVHELLRGLPAIYVDGQGNSWIPKAIRGRP